MPRDGYTAMFERMLAHPNIEVRLRTDYRDVRRQVSYQHLIYTGPVDEYFDRCHGGVPYGSLGFEPETVEREWFQPAVQVNYPNDHAYTRILEIKHITGQTLPVTTVVREYPEDYLPGREPYYPLPAPDARALYQKYEAMTTAGDLPVLQHGPSRRHGSGGVRAVEKRPSALKIENPAQILIIQYFTQKKVVAICLICDKGNEAAIG